MKKSKNVLTAVMICNIVMAIISAVTVYGGISITFNGSKIVNGGSGLFNKGESDGWEAFAGLSGMIGGTLVAIIGMVLIFIGVFTLVMYCVPMIMSIVTRIRFKANYEKNIEDCRKGVKTVSIVSTVINGIVMVAAGIVTLIGGMSYYMLIVFTLMAASLAFSIILIVSTGKDKWYTFREIDEK